MAADATTNAAAASLKTGRVTFANIHQLLFSSAPVRQTPGARQ
jgi:hypothetical protein